MAGVVVLWRSAVVPGEVVKVSASGIFRSCGEGWGSGFFFDEVSFEYCKACLSVAKKHGRAGLAKMVGDPDGLGPRSVRRILDRAEGGS